MTIDDHLNAYHLPTLSPGFPKNFPPCEFQMKQCNSMRCNFSGPQGIGKALVPNNPAYDIFLLGYGHFGVILL